ncbi:MAG: chorismate lyase [Gammaproteobacteria bacterium]|nr:chorismate lyase [Gammaproteobacteria bacterium]
MFSTHREPIWSDARGWHLRHCPATLHSWLTDRHSLTKRLQQACDGQFRVQVVKQFWGRPLQSEREQLALSDHEFCFIRHVQLRCFDQPWVFARTVIPHTTLRGPLRSLTRLGSKPLGAVLFANPAIQRENLQIARLSRGQGMYNAATSGQTNDLDIWGRRSRFRFHHHALLVSEIFLPAHQAY